MPEQTLGGIPLGLEMVMKINVLNLHAATCQSCRRVTGIAVSRLYSQFMGVHRKKTPCNRDKLVAIG